MAVKIILLVLFLALYLGLMALEIFFENVRGKSYKVLDDATRIFAILSGIICAWFALSWFSNGLDSGLGWYVLAFFVAGTVQLLIGIAASRVFNAVWPKRIENGVAVVPVPVNIPVKFKMVAYIWTALCWVAFAVLILYVIIFSHELHGAIEYFLIICALLLCLYGIYDNVKKYLSLSRG